MTVFTDHVELAGASGSGLATDSTGTVLDGAFRTPLDRTRPERYDEASATVNTSLSTVGSIDYDVTVENYTTGETIGSITGVTTELTGQFVPVDLGAVSDGDELGVSFVVTTATGTGGSTADLGVTLTLDGTK